MLLYALKHELHIGLTISIPPLKLEDFSNLRNFQAFAAHKAGRMWPDSLESKYASPVRGDTKCQNGAFSRTKWASADAG